MKLKKIIYIVCAFLVLPVLFGCADKGNGGEKYASVLGEDVYFDEVRYLTLNYKADMAAKYGDGIWEKAGENYRAELEEKVNSAIKKEAAERTLFAEYGVDTDSKDVKKYVSDYIKNAKKELGGSGEYKKQLAENFMTERYLKSVLTTEKCFDSLRNALCTAGKIDTSDETVKNVIKNEFIRTLHVYISNDDGDDVAENRAKAEKVLSLLEEGTPLNTLIGRYSEDYYMVTTDGYYFMRGEYESAYEDAAFALDEGEYSGVVEGENGFYVIVRLEKDDKYISANFETLKDRYIYAVAERIIAEKAENAEIELTDFGKSTDFLKIQSEGDR